MMFNVHKLSSEVPFWGILPTSAQLYPGSSPLIPDGLKITTLPAWQLPGLSNIAGAAAQFKVSTGQLPSLL